MAPQEEIPRWRSVLQIVEGASWDRSPISDTFSLNLGSIIIWVQLQVDFVQIEASHTGHSRHLPLGQLQQAQGVVEELKKARESDQMRWSKDNPTAEDDSPFVGVGLVGGLEEQVRTRINRSPYAQDGTYNRT
jgi:hypothetical protein